MDKRSNQHNEGGNAFHNFVGRAIVRKGASPTLESWIQQQRLLENEAVGRWREIHTGGRDYKKKNKKSARLDKILMSYRNYKEHENGKLSDNEYFDQCVVAIQKSWALYDS